MYKQNTMSVLLVAPTKFKVISTVLDRQSQRVADMWLYM